MTDNEFIELLDSISSDVIASNNEDVFTVGDVLDLIKRKDAEIERLEKANESFSDMGKLYSEIKSEAIKEFADEFVKYIGEEIAECGEVDPNTTPIAYGTVLGLRSAIGYVEAIVMVGDTNERTILKTWEKVGNKNE